MLVKFMYTIFLMILVAGSVSLSKVLIKKFKINRWIVAFIAPLILIIPSISFENLNKVVWTILITIFFVMCILFFELNREIDEVKRSKTITNYRKNR